MNKEELRKILDAEDISERAYSLEGGNPSERYCLSQNYNIWSVYYSERGLKTGEKIFLNEHEACKYLLEILIADPTTRKERYK